jgi:hypothetical protein
MPPPGDKSNGHIDGLEGEGGAVPADSKVASAGVFIGDGITLCCCCCGCWRRCCEDDNTAAGGGAAPRGGGCGIGEDWLMVLCYLLFAFLVNCDFYSKIPLVAGMYLIFPPFFSFFLIILLLFWCWSIFLLFFGI